jgi:cytoskeletal protein CcmA (bactofilin family)
MKFRLTPHRRCETIGCGAKMHSRLVRPVITGLASFVAIALFVSAGSSQQDDQRRFGRESILPAGTVINGDYFAFGSVAEISGTVNGDVYAFAGQVLIDGHVNGDVIAAGGRINISGTVSQDVRAAGGQVTLTGSVGRNLTVAAGNAELASSAVVRGGLVAAGGNIDLSAPLGGDCRVAAGTLILSNKIGGGVNAAVGTLRVGSRAAIQGDLNYWSSRDASISEGARIEGKISRRAPPQKPKLWPAVLAAWALLLAVSFVSTLILGILSIRFLPNFHSSTVAILRDQPWKSVGIGFVAVIVMPVLCIVLFALVLTTPIALMLLAAFFILLYWSRIFAISRIGEAIVGRFRASPGPFASFLTGLIVYYLLAIIPVVGWLVIVLAVVFGLGAELEARKHLYTAARTQAML